jgi:hypothetical protein
MIRSKLDRPAWRRFSPADNLLREAEVGKMKQIPLLAPVALIEDLPGKGLTRGQIGTVVEQLERDEERAILVEFCDSEGQTYAMEALRPDQVLVLHRDTEAA